ncbi:MAG TPA: hypothetical protein VFW76_03020, partial [Ktedonobacterales bacterium]|nr:hypothetical protein [Ktedonobacterales bacterium]
MASSSVVSVCPFLSSTSSLLKCHGRRLVVHITSKVVLILGSFSAERKPVLDALREALRRHPNGYIPVLFDFEPQASRPVLETVKTLANLARFVIADLT